MTNLGVGVVGANLDGHGGLGSWGAWAHLPALNAIKGLKPVAVATRHRSSAEMTAAKFDVPKAYDDWRQLIEDRSVDIVTVCVRVPLHFEIVTAAIEAGKIVYCEWPLGRDSAEAEQMLNAAEKHNIIHAVGLQARSSPLLRYLRDLIAAGEIGTVRSALLTHSSDWMSHVLPENCYLQDKNTGAHFLSIPGGHSLDALCWILGDFDYLNAIVKTTVPTLKMHGTAEIVKRTSPDQILVSGITKSGVIVGVRLSAATLRGVGVRIEISGDDGDIIVVEEPGLHGVQVSNLNLYRSVADGQLKLIEIPEAYYRIPESIRKGSCANVAEAYLALLAKVAGGTDNLPDFGDALRCHRLLDRVENAARRDCRE